MQRAGRRARARGGCGGALCFVLFRVLEGAGGEGWGACEAPPVQRAGGRARARGAGRCVVSVCRFVCSMGVLCVLGARFGLGCALEAARQNARDMRHNNTQQHNYTTYTNNKQQGWFKAEQEDGGAGGRCAMANPKEPSLKEPVIVAGARWRWCWWWLVMLCGAACCVLLLLVVAVVVLVLLLVVLLRAAASPANNARTQTQPTQ